MSVENAYRMVRKLVDKSRGLGKPKGADAEIVKILLELNPDTLVHAYAKGDPICGRLRETHWLSETRWPVTEVWVGIRSGEVVNCLGCQARLGEVLAAADLEERAWAEEQAKRRA
jgi:hypothetical protein